MSKNHRRTPAERLAARDARATRGTAARARDAIDRIHAQARDEAIAQLPKFHTWIEPRFIGHTVTLITLPHDGTRTETKVGWRLRHAAAQKLAVRASTTAALLAAATIEGRRS